MFSIRAHTILVGEKPSAKSRFQGRGYTPLLMHFRNNPPKRRMSHYTFTPRSPPLNR